MADLAHRFWETKSLHEMSHDEWEALCDGCGRCCLIKYEHVPTRKLAVTSVACSLLDLETCRCTDYAHRHDLIEECVELDSDNISELYWLPETCGYRLVAEQKPLFDWHPLISGDRNTVREAGISIHGKAISERDVHPDDIEAQFVRWVD